MDKIKYSHQTNVNKHQVERLDALYNPYHQYLEKGDFLSIYGILAIIIFSFFYSSLIYDVPIEARTPSSVIEYYFHNFSVPDFQLVFIPSAFLIIWFDRYIRFGNLPLDILSDYQLEYIKSDLTLSCYFRDALTKNMKIKNSFFNNVDSYRDVLKHQINSSIKFSQDEESAKKRQKAIDIAKSI